MLAHSHDIIAHWVVDSQGLLCLQVESCEGESVEEGHELFEFNQVLEYIYQILERHVLSHEHMLQYHVNTLAVSFFYRHMEDSVLLQPLIAFLLSIQEDPSDITNKSAFLFRIFGGHFVLLSEGILADNAHIMVVTGVFDTDLEPFLHSFAEGD